MMVLFWMLGILVTVLFVFQRKKERYSQGILLLSATDHARAWTILIQQNHQHFCDRNHIRYHHIVQPHPEMEGTMPQWSKIRWLLDSMGTGYEYVIWIDDDIVITRTRNFFQEFLTQAPLLVIRDAGDPLQVNTGILIVRDCPEAHSILSKIWEKRKTHLGKCPDQTCLHEQEALNQLLKEDPKVMHHTKIMMPREGGRNLNTFHRESHHDWRRKRFLNYADDPVTYSWKKGDNTCHCTGMSEELRMRKIQECLGEVIEH